MRLIYKTEYDRLCKEDISYISLGADILEDIGLIHQGEHFYIASVVASKSFMDIPRRNPYILDTFTHKPIFDYSGIPYCRVRKFVYIASYDNGDIGRGSMYLRDISALIVTSQKSYIELCYRVFDDEFIRYVMNPGFMYGKLVELNGQKPNF